MSVSKDCCLQSSSGDGAAYSCFLLVRTLYFPRSHNIKFLRSLAEDKEPRLIEAFPRDTKLDRRRFELLKRAYVEARYSANYEISSDDLAALTSAFAACAISLNRSHASGWSVLKAKHFLKRRDRHYRDD